MFETIPVPIDLEHDEQNRCILGAAKTVADADGADVHLLQVVAAAGLGLQTPTDTPPVREDRPKQRSAPFRPPRGPIAQLHQKAQYGGSFEEGRLGRHATLER